MEPRQERPVTNIWTDRRRIGQAFRSAIQTLRRRESPGERPRNPVGRRAPANNNSSSDSTEIHRLPILQRTASSARRLAAQLTPRRLLRNLLERGSSDEEVVVYDPQNRWNTVAQSPDDQLEANILRESERLVQEINEDNAAFDRNLAITRDYQRAQTVQNLETHLEQLNLDQQASTSRGPWIQVQNWWEAPYLVQSQTGTNPLRITPLVVSSNEILDHVEVDNQLAGDNWTSPQVSVHVVHHFLHHSTNRILAEARNQGYLGRLVHRAGSTAYEEITEVQIRDLSVATDDTYVEQYGAEEEHNAITELQTISENFRQLLATANEGDFRLFETPEEYSYLSRIALDLDNLIERLVDRGTPEPEFVVDPNSDPSIGQFIAGQIEVERRYLLNLNHLSSEIYGAHLQRYASLRRSQELHRNFVRSRTL